MEQTSSYLFIFGKQIMFCFFLHYIPCKELNVGHNFKIKAKSLFKFSSCSHSEIWKFQGVTTTPRRPTCTWGGGCRIISGLTSSSAPHATYQRQSTSPGRLSSVPAPCWHNNRRRCHASAASRAPCRRHGRPCYHRCHQQPVLPSQAHSSRQHSSRSASIAASRRQNNLSVVVKGYATVMSPSSAVTSASACSTSSWATTRTTTTPPRTLR
jgi:hypothetical protein